jgi:hypothetical protein
MSHHILHQFDEQWFTDKSEQPSLRWTDKAPDETKGRDELAQSISMRLQHWRQWLALMLALTLALTALLFALDARRRAADLNERVIKLENQR